MVSPLAERAGGAQQAAARIAGMLPEHTHDVQLQSGGVEVLLHKHPSQAETINDTSQDIVTFWRVLRDRPHELRRVCALTPLSRIEFDTARSSGSHLGGDELEAARRVWFENDDTARLAHATLTVPAAGPPVALSSNPLPVQQSLFDVEAAAVGTDTP